MQIKLSNCNLCVEIDAEDLNNVLKHTESWCGSFDRNGKIKAIVGNSIILGKCISLSKAVLNYFGDLDIDHKDRNVLNNTKDNLRVVTRQQNLQNRDKSSKITKSKYKGVSIHKRNKTNPFCAYIQHNRRTIWGGVFPTEEAAAYKANELMKQYHGEYAVLNIIDN